MKKTLFILPSLDGGGAERVCINLIAELKKQGRDVGLVVITRKGELLGVAPEGTYYLKGGILNKLMTLRQIIDQYQIVVGSLELMGYVWSWLAVLFKPQPLFLWLHKDLVGFFSYTPFWKVVTYKYVLALILKRTDATVCVSKTTLTNFRKLYPKRNVKATYCYNPMDFLNIKVLSEKKPKNIPKEYFLAVGRLEYQKGLDYLIDAYHKSKRNGLDIPLIILGDGSHRDALEKKINSLGLSDNILLLGFKPPYYYMKYAKALFLTSRMEALPTVLIESIFLNTPFIAFDCESGPKEISDYFGVGTIVKNQDTLAFSRAIDQYALTEYISPIPSEKFKLFSKEVTSMYWNRLLG